MVSVKLYGGLANNFFQIATCIATALKYNTKYCIPTEIKNPHYGGQKVFYSKYLNYCDESRGRTLIARYTYKEPHFHYAEIPEPDHYFILDGYWQSARYFDDYREEILRLFNIPYEFKKGWISVHVRRGNYLLYSNCHKVVDSEYIQSAINKIKELSGSRNGWKVLVVSDDIEWCKENMTSMFTSSNDVEFSEGKTELADLTLASCCEHSIGSASSFSWWLYYLNRNKNKIGIFPQKDKWFGEALPHNVDDLYLPEWILV